MRFYIAYNNYVQIYVRGELRTMCTLYIQPYVNISIHVFSVKKLFSVYTINMSYNTQHYTPVSTTESNILTNTFTHLYAPRGMIQMN
jgi:hypothetical protein